MKFEHAPDIKEKVRKIINVLELKHMDISRIICMRSYGSKSRAQARIWNFPRIWQKGLNIKPHYIIEVIHPRFDNLSKEEQEKTLIHEILHIPKKFSGGFVPHKCFGKRIDKRIVDELYKKYVKLNKGV